MFLSRITRAIFVGYHDRTGAGLWCITKSGLWRGKSWTRAPWQDAWCATTWEGWCRTPRQMVVLAKKVTADQERGAQYMTECCSGTKSRHRTGTFLNVTGTKQSGRSRWKMSWTGEAGMDACRWIIAETASESRKSGRENRKRERDYAKGIAKKRRSI